MGDGWGEDAALPTEFCKYDPPPPILQICPIDDLNDRGHQIFPNIVCLQNFALLFYEMRIFPHITPQFALYVLQKFLSEFCKKMPSFFMR